jgi:hypothetical protein
MKLSAQSNTNVLNESVNSLQLDIKIEPNVISARGSLVIELRL